MAALSSDLGGADMGGKKCRQPRRVAARHAAFGCHAADACVALRRPQPCRIAWRIAVMNQTKVEPGLGVQTQVFEWHKIGVVGAVLRHRHMEELDRTPDAGTNG